MSGTSVPLAKPPLPVERPRFPAGTSVGGRKVGGQYMSDSIVAAAREGMVSQEELDKAQKTIDDQQQQIDQVQKELQDQQEQVNQVQKEVNAQKSSRMQRLASVVLRTIAPIRALGPLGVIRNINRAASAGGSLINFDLMDSRRVAEASGYGLSRMGTSPGGGFSTGAERTLFRISRDISAVRGSISRIETKVSKLAGDTPALGSSAPRVANQEQGQGGILGLIGSIIGGLSLGGGIIGNIGGAIRRLISTVARAIFTRIPIIGPLILLALNIEGAMEEYERNGLGAAVTELLAGIGSDLTFGIIDRDTIRNFVNNSTRQVGEWWESTKTSFRQTIDSVFASVRDFYNEVKKTITDVLSNIPGIGEVVRRVRELFNLPEGPSIGSIRAEDQARAGLEVTGATPAGNPGQAAARSIARSYDISTREYGDIEDILLTPRPGETEEQKAERERLSALQGAAGRAAATSGGGNVQLVEGVAEFVSRIRAEDAERAIEAGTAENRRITESVSPETAFGRVSEEEARAQGIPLQSAIRVQPRSIDPNQATAFGRVSEEEARAQGIPLQSAIRVQPRSIDPNQATAQAQPRNRRNQRTQVVEVGPELQAQPRNRRNQRTQVVEVGPELQAQNRILYDTIIRYAVMENIDPSNLSTAQIDSNGTVVSLVALGRTVDVTDISTGPNRGLNNIQPPELAPPVSGDTRPQSMSNTGNQTPVVIVNNSSSGGGQTPAGSSPPPNNTATVAVGRQGGSVSPHPPRPSDVGSAATRGGGAE